jgi:hypothetical protein
MKRGLIHHQAARRYTIGPKERETEPRVKTTEAAQADLCRGDKTLAASAFPALANVMDKARLSSSIHENRIFPRTGYTRFGRGVVSRFMKSLKCYHWGPQSSSWPNTLPVFRLTRCSPAQAAHLTASYSFSEISGSSSNSCWT